MKKKYIITAGNKYNKLIAIRKVDTIIRRKKCWLFKCECGKEKEIPAADVFSGAIKTCGCGQSRFKNLTGKKYGMLTVIKPVGKNHSDNTIWLCECSCGKYTNVINSNLIMGVTNSCGCLIGNKVDLKNKKFGKLIAIKDIGRNNRGKVLWECVCECGNKTIVNSNALMTGNTKSCGRCNLLIKTNSKIIEEWNFEKNKDVDINSMTIGSNKKVWWICSKCKYEWQANIHNRFGLKSGCPKCRSPSKAQDKFRKILIENRIEFKEEKKFPDCKYKSQLKFDFYIQSKNLLIELQGEQHYKKRRNKGADQQFELIRIRDQIKRDYCKNNNIKLVEIHYKDFTEKRMIEILKEEGIING